jgi:hypothetical protein
MKDLLIRLLEPKRRGWLRRLWYRYLYTRSDHWRNFRQIVGKRRGWKCSVRGCKAKGRHLDVHHIVYKLWHERVADVEIVCRWHHKQEHGR